jgi:hypothetical protein
MSATPTLSTQLIGQTEKTLNAILGRLLAGSGLSEPQWVTLTLAVMSRGPIERDALVDRVGDALKISEAEARARVDELAAAELIEAEGSSVEVSGAGNELHARIRGGRRDHRTHVGRPAGRGPGRRRARPDHGARASQRRAGSRLRRRGRPLATRARLFRHSRPVRR